MNTSPKPLEQSPASRVMDEAIELAIEERSPYPERSAFLNADSPRLGTDIRRAVDDGMAIVLVSADGSVRVLRGEPMRDAEEADDGTRTHDLLHGKRKMGRHVPQRPGKMA